MTLEDKTIGCLLGGAIGDALGMPLNGLTREEIAATGPVLDFLPSARITSLIVPVAELGEAEIGDPLLAGQWTGITQLTLHLAETLLDENGLLVPEAWAHRFVRWLHNEPRHPDSSSLYTGMLLRAGDLNWDEAAEPDGSSGETAARVAPVALAYANAPERRRRAALLQSQVSHGSPDAHAAALAVAEAIVRVLPVDSDALAAWDSVSFLNGLVETVRDASPEFAEFARCLALVPLLIEDDVPPASAIQALGVTEWARESVPTAFYCVARTPNDFEAILTNAVNLTGGAVSTIAAIAGSVAGALHGVEAIPERWRSGVEESERILATARALTRLSQGL